MNPWLILAALAALAGAFGSGAYTHKRWADGKAAEAALMASEAARKIEREQAVSSIRKLDNYAAAQADNERRALTARSDLERLRNAIAATASATPASCPADERVGRLADLLRESAELSEEGARHVDDLRAKRDALK